MFPFLTGPVHKSTLTSLLNSTSAEKLSKDRLRRVRSKATTLQDCEPDLTVDYRKEIGLFHDVAIFIKDRGVPTTYLLGRVQHMTKKSENRGKIEYRRPINLDDPQHQGVEIYVTVYQEAGEVFRYCPGNTKLFMAYSVIMGVQLTVQDDDSFVLSATDKQELNCFIDSNRKSSKRRAGTKATSNVQTANDSTTVFPPSKDLQVGDDGRVVVLVEPVSSEDGQRRSQRKRKAVVFDDYM